jgi:CRISPR-associated protein Csx10
MKALTYRLRLLEPVLVAQAEGGEENSAVGLPFIPGSAVRGALVARYLARNAIANLATDGKARRLFLDGAICFLNAYPWLEDSRLLPRPLSWFVEKDRVGDLSAPILDGAVAPVGSLKQPKPPPGEFCALTGDEVALHTPLRQMNVHIALINANRRGEENKVYRYDALAEGAVFAGVVLAREASELEGIETLLAPEELQIGAAHTAGYGRVKIEAVDRPAYWEEYLPGGDPDDGVLVVTLISDAILRGEGGQVGADLDKALSAALGLPAVGPLRACRRVRVVAGFNRKWSLPLTQSWALQAGSVIVYAGGAGLDRAALQAAEEEGIGERRAEGFGRVAINWHTHAFLNRYEFQPDVPSPPDLSGGSKALAKQMAQRRLRLLLEQYLAGAVSRLEPAPRPPNAQLSRVRNAVQEGLARGDLGPVLAHLRDLKGAREQFERARVASVPLLTWIKGRAEGLDVDTQLLRGAPLPKVAGEEAGLTRELRVEYTGRLIDGLMKKAIKKNQEDKT